MQASFFREASNIENVAVVLQHANFQRHTFRVTDEPRWAIEPGFFPGTRED